MSSSRDIEFRADFCDLEVILGVDYDFVTGDSGSAPSLSHPGEPSTGPEITITKIEFRSITKIRQPAVWDEMAQAFTYPKPKEKFGDWHEITGPLFDLLAGSQWIIDQIVEREEDRYSDYYPED